MNGINQIVDAVTGLSAVKQFCTDNIHNLHIVYL